MGDVVAGLFLALFGATLLLTGGACTIFWVSVTLEDPWHGLLQSLLLLGISLATVFFGYVSLKAAVGSFRGRPLPAPEDEA